MSLNHLVQNGAEPPLNLVCNNLAIDGRIQTSQFASERFDPQITVSSAGSGQALVSKQDASAIRMEDQTTVSYKCVIATGTGAPSIDLLFEPPSWLPETTGVLDTLKCVVNAEHQRGDLAWESLINQNVTVGDSAPGTTDRLVLTLGRADNINFPLTKEFTVNCTFTFSQPV
jgi:hypothetical protein